MVVAAKVAAKVFTHRIRLSMLPVHVILCFSPESGSPTGCYPAGCSRIQVQNFFLCSTWLSFKGCTVDTCTDKYTNIHVGSEMVAISKCPIKMKYTVLETMKLYHCMKLHDMTWHDAMSGLSPFLTAPLAVLLTSLPKTRRWTETNLPHAGIEPGMLGLRASHHWLATTAALINYDMMSGRDYSLCNVFLDYALN